MYRRRAAVLALLLCDGAVLVTGRRGVEDVASHIGRLHSWLSAVGTDAALTEAAATGLWLAAAWLALGLLAAGTGLLPGLTGRVGLLVSRTVLPRALVRLVAGSAGLGILLAPAAANAAPPGAAHNAPPAVALPAPGWPVDPCRHISTPSPLWPTGHPPTSSPPQTGVRVEPGDSLWLIAARHLGPAATAAQVATEWPRWYAGNRAVIGADPGLIRPGQLLQPPRT